jgi:hypothetical protein
VLQQAAGDRQQRRSCDATSQHTTAYRPQALLIQPLLGRIYATVPTPAHSILGEGEMYLANRTLHSLYTRPTGSNESVFQQLAFVCSAGTQLPGTITTPSRLLPLTVVKCQCLSGWWWHLWPPPVMQHPQCLSGGVTPGPGGGCFLPAYPPAQHQRSTPPLSSASVGQHGIKWPGGSCASMISIWRSGFLV